MGRQCTVSVRAMPSIAGTRTARPASLSAESLRKYKRLKGVAYHSTPGDKQIRTLSMDDVRKLRESWTHSPGTQAKMLELVRSFFRFCVDSGWIEKNPAKGIKAPQSRVVPTLPYSDAEWKDILTALDVYASIHNQSPLRIQKQLRALILVMRYSGLRISDAVGLERSRIDSSGNLFIYQAKTGNPVSVPLPKLVLDALADCGEEGRRYFWNGEKTLKTVTTDWSARMKKVFIARPGLPEGTFPSAARHVRRIAAFTVGGVSLPDMGVDLVGTR